MAKAKIEQLSQPGGFEDAIDRLEDATVTRHLESMRDLDDAARRNRELVPAGQFDRGRGHSFGAIRRWKIMRCFLKGSVGV
jgi:hypothetical protein